MKDVADMLYLDVVRGYPRRDEGVAQQVDSRFPRTSYSQFQISSSSRPLNVALVICAVLDALTQHLQQQFEQQMSYKAACVNIAAIFEPSANSERAKQIERILERCKALREICSRAENSAEAYRADRPVYLTPEADYRFDPAQWSSYPESFRIEIVVRHRTFSLLFLVYL